MKLKKKYYILITSLILFISFNLLIYSLINILNWEKDNTNTKEITALIEETNNNDLIDFNKLLDINDNTVAYIKVNGTNINYPVVQTTNNTYYLTHSFDKTYNEAGWVFMDYRNNDLNNKNTIIYAHSRLDKSMFGSLKNVYTNEWYTNKDNYVIRLDTVKDVYYYKIFSVYNIDTEEYYIKTDFNSTYEYKEFLNTIKDRSRLYFESNLTTSDKILTLSTCFKNNQKLVVHAYLLQ